MPVVRESRKARKKEDAENTQDTGAGDGAEPRASAGQAGAGRGRVNGNVDEERSPADVCDTGDGLHPHARIGQTGAARGGLLAWENA